MATSAVDNVFEFRGVEDVFYAEVTSDTETEYKVGTPKRLSYTATISKEVETSSETHFYDNKGMIVINAKGAETFTFTVAPPKLEVLAEITGQAFDADSGMLIEGEITPKVFAVGYKTKGTDGYWRYVWKYKGSFAIPSEEVNTESDSIDTTNTELTFTSIQTIHKFAYQDGSGDTAETKNKSISGIVVDERYGTKNVFENWSKRVYTPNEVHNDIVGSV